MIGEIVNEVPLKISFKLNVDIQILDCSEKLYQSEAFSVSFYFLLNENKMEILTFKSILYLHVYINKLYTLNLSNIYRLSFRVLSKLKSKYTYLDKINYIDRRYDKVYIIRNILNRMLLIHQPYYIYLIKTYYGSLNILHSENKLYSNAIDINILNKYDMPTFNLLSKIILLMYVHIASIMFIVSKIQDYIIAINSTQKKISFVNPVLIKNTEKESVKRWDYKTGCILLKNLFIIHIISNYCSNVIIVRESTVKSYSRNNFILLIDEENEDILYLRVLDVYSELYKIKNIVHHLNRYRSFSFKILKKYTKHYNLNKLSIYLRKYYDEKTLNLVDEDYCTFIIIAKLIKELKQYIIKNEFKIDSITAYHLIEDRIASNLSIELKLELYNTELFKEKEADSKEFTTFEKLIPGNKYKLKIIAKLKITEDFSLNEYNELEVITRPISFEHNVATIEPNKGDYTFLVQWKYFNDFVNKDVKLHTIRVFDKIPSDEAWDYTESVNNPTKIENKKEVSEPILIESYEVNNSNRNKYILNPFKQDRLAKGNYRWIQLETFIRYDKNNIKYKEEE